MLAIDTFIQRLLFKPLPKPSYDFDFRHRRRHLIHVPIALPSSERPNSVRGLVDSAAAAAAPVLQSIDEALSHPTGYVVPVMWIPRVKEPAGGERTVIVHFHGTSGDIEKSHLYATMQDRMPDVDVLLVEFPGYAIAAPTLHNSGTPFYASCATTTAIAREVLRHCLLRWHLTERNIILSGRSMGTGIAVHLAANLFPSVAGLLLISPYSSISDIVRDLKPPFGRALQFAFRGDAFFHSERDMARVTCPVLVCHGAKDTLIRLAHAERLIHALNKNNNRRQGGTSPKTEEKSEEEEQKRLWSTSQRSRGTTADEYVTLHVDPNGTHTELEYEDALVSFVQQILRTQRGVARESSSGSRDVPTKPLVDLSVYSPPTDGPLVSELRRRLGTSRAVLAGRVKRSRIRLLVVTAVTLLTAFWLLRKKS